MGSTQSNDATDILEVNNNILQASNETCIVNCTATQQNATNIIDGSNIRGNVEIVQACNAQASCIMQSTLDTQVQNIMNAIADQTSSAQRGMFSFNSTDQTNSSYIKESITNQITQVMNSTCQADTTITQINNLNVLRDSTVGGNYFLGQGVTPDGKITTASANCTMNNTARTVAFNQQTAQSSQKEKITSALAIIIIAIVIGIIIIGGLVCIFLLSPQGQKAVAQQIGKSGASGAKATSGAKSGAKSGGMSVEEKALLM